MTIPIHRYRKVGKYIINSYLSFDEIHITCSLDKGMIYQAAFKLEDVTEFTECFNNLVLIAEIKTSIKMQHEKTKPRPLA